MTVIVVSFAVVALTIVGLVVFLAFRDRGRDWSSREVPRRDDWDVAASSGVAGYRHEQSPHS